MTCSVARKHTQEETATLGGRLYYLRIPRYSSPQRGGYLMSWNRTVTWRRTSTASPL